MKLLFLVLLVSCAPRDASEEHRCDVQFNMCLSDKHPSIRKTYDLAAYCITQYNECKQSRFERQVD